MASSAKRPREEESTAEAPIENLVELRDRLRSFAKEREWDQFHTPRNLALALVGEIGELCELFQWKGDAGAETGLPNWAAPKKEHLGEELADCLMYIVRLADKCDISLSGAVAKKLRKNGSKYPADRVRGSSKKYTEYAENGGGGGGSTSA